MEDLKIGFIGAGNMAFSICSGIVSKGPVKPCNIWASAPTMTNLKKIEELGCNVTNDNHEVIKMCKVVLLCVKPNKVIKVLEELRSKLSPDHLIISIVSGIKFQQLEQAIQTRTRIIRTVPNTPIQVHLGVLGYCLNSHSTEDDESLFHWLFSNIALCRKVSEEQLSAITGVAGSAPAFVYTVIQSLSDGGVKMGLPRTLATELAAQTVMGSGKMVLETKMHPDALRDAVCSPAGTTICGVHALERGGVRSAFIDAVEQATLKAIEQGNSSP